MSNLATIVNNILADSGIDDINVVVTTGSYSNPAWITALSWSKISSTPTTLSGYGITDAVPAIRTITINGVTQDLSANRTWTITAGVSSVSAGTGISVNQTTGAVTVTNTGTLTVAGTTNQVLVNGGTAAANGNITLSLPQSIATSSSPTFNRISTGGLYGTSGSGNIPIWQYDSNNPGYGIMFYESSPDYLKIDVSGNLVTGTPDFQVSPDTAYVNGNIVLHAGNYNSYAPTLTGGGASGTWGINITGSSSYATSAGNADTVDGYHATNAASGLAYYASNGYLYVPSWINVGNTGIFSGTNNAHLRPNTSTYGSWEMIGSKNGWSGIWFNDSNNTLMMNSAESGHYNNAYGWQFRWYIGYLYVSRSTYGGGTEYTVLDSGNYNSYAPTLTGNGASGTWGINVTGSAGYTQTLALTSLGNGTVNVNNPNTAVYRTETGSGAVLAYAPLLHIGGGDTMWQMQGTYGTSGNGTLYFRQGYNGSWGTWLTMLSSANYSSYALPLSGGELSGTLYVGTISSGIYTQQWKDASGSYIEAIGNTTATRKIRIQSSNSSGSYAQWYVDGGNLQIYGEVAGVANFLFNSSVVFLRYAGSDKFYTGSDGTRNIGWLYMQNTGAGIHYPSNNSHFYQPSGGNYWHINPTENATYGALILYSAYNGTGGGSSFRKGYLYYDTNGFGLLGGGDGAWAININSSTSKYVTIGGDQNTNAYSAVTGVRLMFGGGDSDARGNYYIGTNFENYGGNYNKLDIAWHTGIRIGAQPSYGGVRIFNNEDFGSRLFSVGETDANVRVTNTLYSYAYRGNGNVDGTGEATYHPAGIYSTGTNWLYGTMYLNTNNIRTVGGIGQGSSNTLSRPNVQWGASGTNTGAVVIKLPGNSGNYGMIHAVIDIYEYNGNNVSTVIIGGHNWNGAWYNFGANVIGYTNKQVRLGFKDGQYCIVIGDGSSSWSYGQVVLRKIQNGTYYAGVMEIVSGITVGIESDSYTWVSSDLRQLRVPGNILMNENLVATQSWVNAQGFVTGGPYVPSRGQSNWNDGTVINNVVGMLSWKNYGGGHVIFDASAGTSPSGGGVSQTNSTNAWSATYPTLMGWNGSQTYGVRVDTARYAESIAINYNNDSNSTYQLLWGSGNSVYGTSGVYVNPYSDTVYATEFSSYYGVSVYTSSGADYLRITDNQVYRPNGGYLYLNWSSNANVNITGPSGGRVGVGNNSPAYKMHVSGDIYADGGWLRVSGSAGLYFESYGGGWRMTDSSYIRMYGGKSVSMEGNSVDYVGSIYMNGGVYIQTNNNRNLLVKSSGAADCGILGRGNGDQFAFQIYGSGGDYGFLNSAWGAWDIRKTANGALYMNDNTGYYLFTNSSSYSAIMNGTIRLDSGAFGTNSRSGSSQAAISRTFAPQGASNGWNNGGVSAAIKIRLPFRGNDCMWSMKVRIYNYANDSVSEYTIGNYSYAAGAYHRAAYFIGGTNAAPQTVRFGNDGSYDCVWIGETGTYWSYPQVSVMDFQGGYVRCSVQETANNWDISFVTSFNTVADAITPTVRFSSVYAPIYYDIDNTGYYLDPASTSNLNTLNFGTAYVSGTIRNNGGVGDDDYFGIYWDSGASSAYAIYREAGSWNHPYPDLRIAFHTGISLGANPSYGGIRFFTDYDMSSVVLYVNNASYGGGGNVYATGSITASAFYEISDVRAKTILEENHRVEGIHLIKPKLYTKDGKTELGYIAQDFIEKMPYALTQDGEEKYYSLIYREVHTAKIAYLEDSIEEIKAKILYLEQQLKNKTNENN